MTCGDWLTVLLLICASLAGIIWVAVAPRGTQIIVTSSDQTCFIAPLDQPRSVDLEGPLGKTHLVIDDQGARITDSPCPQKICLSMGPARHKGDLLACVPNHILVRIDSPGSENASYDLLSR
jgi:hypothetical protein